MLLFLCCVPGFGGYNMANNKHLTIYDRTIIEDGLKKNYSFSKIASLLDKSISTISKEVRLHSKSIRTGGFRTQYNACSHRSTCEKKNICFVCHSSRHYKFCKSCSMCNSFCPDFDKVSCRKLSKPPYTCNGCSNRPHCTLEKCFYSATEAHDSYKSLLSECRSGLSFSEADLKHFDETITPLIKQGQSPHHICLTQRDSIMVSERTIYRLIDARLISAMNIDLPRKVRFKPRKNPVHLKVDKACRIGRDYSCFLDLMKSNPDLPVTQLDSVEGKKGGKVLLTIHFVKSELMLAFIRDYNDSKSVTDIFNYIYDTIGHELFSKIFQVCLADNGSEFSNPSAIEFTSDGIKRASVFYCNPSAPYQKGSAERNHEFIRYFIPKGIDLEPYNQQDISLMMNHINSYARPSLADKTPYDMFAFMYGQEILDLLGCHLIPPQEVTLNKSIFHKEV